MRSRWWDARRATSWCSDRSPQGATVDFDVTARLIAGLFERAGISKLSRARVVMSVPSLATPIERRALRQAAVQAGAREVSLIEAPIAAAIGLGLPVQDPVGSAVALLGGGASEAAIISLGGIVTGSARRLGGNDLDAALRRCCEFASGSSSPRRSSRTSSSTSPRPTAPREVSPRSCWRERSTRASSSRSTSTRIS